MRDEYRINTYNCDAMADRIFFVSKDMNLVAEYSLEQDEIRLLPPPDEDMFGRGLYGNVIVADNQLFLIPFNAKYIWKLCHERRWEKIPESESKHREKFLGAVAVDSNIYLLGYRSKEIYKFDTLSYQMTKLNLDIESGFSMGDERYFGRDYEIVDGKIFIPLLCMNQIIELDPETDLIKVIKVPSRANGYIGIRYDGKGFWLAPRKGRYFVHYFLDGRMEEYELPEEYNEDELYFGSAYTEGDQIVFIAPYAENFSFKEEDPRECKMFEPSIYYCKILSNKGKVINERDGQTYYYDRYGNFRKLKLSISNSDKFAYVKKYTQKEMKVIEGMDVSLDEYLKIISFMC